MVDAAPIRKGPAKIPLTASYFPRAGLPTISSRCEAQNLRFFFGPLCLKVPARRSILHNVYRYRKLAH